MRQPPPIAQVGFFLQQPVGNNLVLGRRGDDELAAGLVIWMIDDGQPLPRQVGPILAEEGSFSVFVGADAQAIRRNPVILNRELTEFPRARCRSQRDDQPIGWVRKPDRRPPEITSDTVMPCAKSSANSAMPARTKSRSTVASPAISSVSSLRVSRKT
jgi:hypothetical protein